MFNLVILDYTLREKRGLRKDRHFSFEFHLGPEKLSVALSSKKRHTPTLNVVAQLLMFKLTLVLSHQLRLLQLLLFAFRRQKNCEFFPFIV